MASSRSKSNTNTASSAAATPRISLWCIRLSLLFLTISITLLSIYFSYNLSKLYTQISADESLISSLQNQISTQKTIIDRFNNSITNADVEDHVEELEQSLENTQNEMKDKLERTTAHIQTLLNSTVDRLDQTVKSAQAEIQYEVDMVKGDVQQYVRTTQDQFSMENSFMKFQLAGTFCLLAILISMWHMTAHIRQFKRPFVQRKILAILWMSPIYAVTSWLSLVFPKFEGYLSIIKDFYEAYVIYQFLGFCISVLGRGDREEVVDLLARHTDHLDPPMRWCGWCRGSYVYSSPRQLANAVLLQCQVFAMQFVFFKPLTAVGLFTCQSPKVNFCTFDSNDSTVLWGVHLHIFEDATLWFKIIQNISVFMAFSGLLKFYHAVQDDLAWCNPFPKFLCIKGIVFMTFWQGLVISFLASTTNVGGNPAASAADGSDGGGGSGNGSSDEDADLWGKQAQNFLICLEMLLFSIAHFYCFPTDEWQDGYRPVMEKKVRGLRDNMALGDFVDDLKLILRGSSKDESDEKNKKKKKKKKAQPSGKTDKNLILKDDDGDEDFGGGEGSGKESGNGDEKKGSANEETSDNADNAKNQDSEDKGGDAKEDFGGGHGDDNDEKAGDIEEGFGGGHGNDNGDKAADENENTDKKSDGDEDGKEDEDEDEEEGGSILDISKEDSLDGETMNSLLTSSIRQSLKHKDEEIRNAAHRLLRNRMVDVDRLSQGSLSPSRNDDSTGEGSSVGMGSASAYGALSTGDKNALAYGSMAPMGGDLAASGTDNIGANVDETTSLLGSTNNNNSNDNDLLRPSIFTSVGKSMGAMNNFG